MFRTVIYCEKRKNSPVDVEEGGAPGNEIFQSTRDGSVLLFNAYSSQSKKRGP